MTRWATCENPANRNGRPAQISEKFASAIIAAATAECFKVNIGAGPTALPPSFDPLGFRQTRESAVESPTIGLN